MRVLVACEESQEVCKAFRARGHEAYSNDLQDCSGGHPEWHLKMDALEAIKGRCYGKGWDLIILHPPCTYLAVSGNRWYGRGAALYPRRAEALEWTRGIWIDALFTSDKVVLENPVGVLQLRDLDNKPVKPQYIQPWEHGHGETKKTGLWIYGLSKLKPTNIVEGREQRIWKMPPSADRAKLRSKTFPGIAKAMAEQWG